MRMVEASANRLSANTMLRGLTLEAKRLRDTHGNNQRRQELLQNTGDGSGASSSIQRSKSLNKRAQELTDSLKQTNRLMATEVERSAHSLRSLGN